MKTMIHAAALAAAALGFAATAAATAVVVPLTAQRATANLPDGSSVPMWGYCVPAPVSSAVLPPQLSGGVCAAPPKGALPAWTTGPTITIAPGDTLEIDLTDTLPVPTSIVILGQLGGASGGGLGAVTRSAAPTPHNGQSAVTWPAGDPTQKFTPPAQGTRALSFAPEADSTTAKTYQWSNLKPGTYLYESGSRPSLQVPMGLYGILIVTQAPVAASPASTVAATSLVAGDAYPLAGAKTPTVPYDADVAMLFSEIDPVQNAAVDAAALAHTGVGASVAGAPAAWELAPFNSSACAPACYPPAVNYSPRFFLINGQAFNPTQPQSFPVAGDLASGNVLLRLLNAGSRTHVPSVTGTTVALAAEDGNVLPGLHKVQAEVLLTAGKTYDVLLAPAQTAANTAAATPTPASYTAATLSVFDRALSLTTNNTPFGGMQALILINGTSAGVAAASGTPGGIPTAFTAHAVNDVFTVPVGGTLTGNVRTNDFGVTAVAVGVPTGGTGTPASGGVLTLNADGSFTYVAGAAAGTDSFTYFANGTTAASTAPITATVTITVGSLKGAPVANADTFSSGLASAYTAVHPGVLANDTDGANLALTAVLDSIGSCATVDLKSDGSFVAAPSTGAASCVFTYHAVNSQQTASTPAQATVNFPQGSGITVAVLDSQTRIAIPGSATAAAAMVSDYSWIIEQDLMFQHSGDPALGAASNTLSTNFHRSYMPLIATGCTGPRSCGDGNTVNGAPIKALPRSLPGDAALDFTGGKRYYLSVVPADASDGAVADPTTTPPTPATIGHGMGGVELTTAHSAALAAGQADVTVLTPQNPLPVANLSVFVFEDNAPTNGDVDEGEPGLGGFQVNIFDVRGSSGDAAGQMTYDLAGMPLRNGLFGMPGCPELKTPIPAGTIYTCPNPPVRTPPAAGSTAAVVAAYRALVAQDAIDYKLAGMALVPNMIPGRVTVEAIPNASRSIKGEKWIQVSTLEGGKPVDTFVKAGEPAYWQEFGAPGFHSFIGFMNVDHINAVNAATKGTSTLTGVISSLHMDRPSAANLNDSCSTVSGTAPADGSCRQALSYTTCYVALNTGLSGTGQNVAFTTCDDKGNFTLTNVPQGDHELVIWDQWLDQIIAKKAVKIDQPSVDVGHIPVFSWFTRVEQSAYMDLNGNGLRDPGEPGLSKVPMLIRFRDGSISNFLSTDGDGRATANELFPLFNWYVIESDTTRYKGTGVNVAYDAGGKPDAAPMSIAVKGLGNTSLQMDFTGVLNSTENPAVALPAAQQVAGAVYTPGTTVRVDPGSTLSEGLQGFINQTAKLDWGKTPYAAGETGGITGLVYYASTRGFDDPSLEVQFSWEPAIPLVPVNLYSRQKNADGTVSLVLIDKTTTSSWDVAAAGIHCPGQAADAFSSVALANNLTKCYDGQHVFNQVQPAVYDGRYHFPTAAVNTAYLNSNANGSTLKPGDYIVEVVPPTGYEIVKEESKNILIGEPWNALGQTQFLGLGNIFILPDQATLNSSNQAGARFAQPACVGAMHTVPDYLTLFSDNQQYSPFAGQDRPLCDRKELNLVDQTQGVADFQLFTPAPLAAHFVGIMLNDAAAEFDPVSPSFGEKASLPNAPISIRDFNGVEILRTYNDKWGSFNGLAPSTLAANVPNPSGYSPNMLTTCMNDPGPIKDTRVNSKTFGQMIPDPMYNPMYSNFCYVWPFMPGSTVYLDTPVLPTAAFASASTYQPVDCQYPDATPAVKRVDGPAGHGPWINTTTGLRTLTVTALGDTDVLNPAYSGPTALTPQTNTTKVTRHYGFGAAGSGGTITLRRTTAAGVVITTPLAMTNVVWSDSVIKADVPAAFVAGDSGELIITNGVSHRTSVDTVTVSVESKDPTIVYPNALYTADPTAPDSLNYPQPLQTAMDAALPGSLVIVEAGSYPELVVMWKPVRLQGVGAASVTINATKFPNRKVADWRGRINALFGVDPIKDTVAANAQVSPLPGQTLTGGIVLLEPTVLSTEEGAGITVLASDDSIATNVCPAGGFTGTGPVVTVDKTGLTTPDTVPLVTVSGNNPAWSNFNCAAARIDGVTVTGGDSGGGIYVNGWAHRLQIANNRVYGNAGPFSGGVRIGQPYLEGAVNTGISAGGVVLGYNRSVNIHHNAITTNGMVEGNAAAGATAAGGAGGGLSICSGTDNYKVNYNFICGNFASSDGGGMGHIGLSNNGSIAFNQILFNESFNQTSAQNGGGLVIEGETAVAGGVSPGSGSVTIDANVIQGNFARAGTGGGLRLQGTNGADLLCEVSNVCAPGQTRSWLVTVTNNIIANNLAGSAGGGVSMIDSFGAVFNNNTIVSNDSTGIAGNLFNTMVGTISTGPITGVPGPAGIVAEPSSPQLLNSLPAGRRASRQVSTPTLVNNIIWQNRSFFFDGKRQDPATKVIPMVASNNWTDAVTHGGVELAAQAATGACDANAVYWDLGILGDQTPLAPPVVSIAITSVTHPTTGPLLAQHLVTFTTATAHGLGAGDAITVSGFTGASTIYNAATVVLTAPTATTFTVRMGILLTLPASPSTQTTGVLGGAALQGLAHGLHPTNSVLTPVTYALYNAQSTTQGNIDGGASGQANFVKQYCNGSRQIPGVQFEPGTPFQPAFQLDAAATLDESGNFVDLHFGPISMGDPLTGLTNGDYHLPNALAPGYAVAALAPANNHDVDNDLRPRLNGSSDIGADQFMPVLAAATLTPNPLAFGSQNVTTTSAVQTLTYANTGGTVLTITTVAVGGANPANFAIPAAGNLCLNVALQPGASCTIGVTFTPNVAAARAGTVTVTATGIAVQTAALTGTGTGGPLATLTPDPILFGTVAVNSTSSVQTATYSNTGTIPLTVASVALAGSANFAIAAGGNGCLNAVLAPAATCSIRLTFSPTAAVVRTGTLTVRDTAGGATPQAVTLTGTGSGVAVVGFSWTNNGAVGAWVNSASTRNIIVTNVGTANLTLTAAPLLANVTLNEFTLAAAQPANPCSSGAVLAPGATCQVAVTRLRPAAGNAAATLTFTDTGAATTTQVQNLSGT